MRLRRILNSFAANESGATAIEYGLIGALIFLVILMAVTTVSTDTANMYGLIASAMSGI
jgi:pilus assembly protein Flp/PilA